MKKMALIMYALLMGIFMSGTIKADNNKFIFKGRIGGMGRVANFVYTDTFGERAFQKVVFQDGCFSIELQLAEPQVVELNSRVFCKMVDNGFVPCNSGSLMFVAVTGQTLEVDGDLKKDFVDLYPGGDVENDIFRKYTSALHPVQNESVNLMIANWTDSTLTEEDKAANLRKMEEYEKEMQDIRMGSSRSMCHQLVVCGY